MSADFVVALAEPGPEPERSAPSGIVTGQPVQAVRNYYADPTSACYLIEGSVELTDPAGRASRFTAGNAFIVRAGFKGTWETLTPARKFYAIYERKSG
jgi:uncharacterized protein